MSDVPSIEELVTTHAMVERDHGAKVELFHRRVKRVKVGRSSAGVAPHRASGSEEGLALRILGDDGGCSFAACSGGGLGAATWAYRAAASSGCQTVGYWGPGDGGPVFDLEPFPDLPSDRHLESWLESAIEALGEVGVSGPAGGIGEAWIEAGTSVEHWVAHGGRTARRTRSRIWAVARVGGYGCRPSLVGAAARWLHLLPPDTWAEQVARAGAPKRQAIRTIVFDGEAAARLALELAREVHGPGARPGLLVGDGWQIVDDPLDPEGVTGGTFDDAGFPTATCLLADGVRTRGVLGTLGHLRRPSFRDFPTPQFSTLAVHGRPVDPPSSAARVRDLRIHRLSPDRWILDAAGAYSLEASPAQLLARCVGTTGSAHRSPLGVLTPALVIDGWTRGTGETGQPG